MRGSTGGRLASFAVGLVLFATWAELLDVKAIWIVATILFGDVITLFTFRARQSDLRTNIGAFARHWIASR